MRIVCVSDLHLDASTAGVPRFEDVRGSLMVAVRAAVSMRVDAFLFGGDACDPDSGSCVFRCVAALVEAAAALDREGIPSVWLAGNHDVIEDGTGQTVLEPLKHVAPGRVFVGDRPGWFFLPAREEARVLGVAVLPYTALCASYDPAVEARRAMERVKECHRSVVLGHLMLEGIQPGEETLEMPRGRDVAFPFAEVAGADVALNGHYHRRQEYRGVQVIGALARLKLGHDEDLEPAFLTVDL